MDRAASSVGRRCLSASRIAVIGCSGAGKSTLVAGLADRLGLPIIHLDAHYWRPGWDRATWTTGSRGKRQLFAGDAWVADGNFHSTLPYRCSRADTVVFLDFPRRTCLRGVFGRLLRQYGQVRGDMPAGCPERFDWEFTRWVWNFRRDARPRVLEVLRRLRAARRPPRHAARAARRRRLPTQPADLSLPMPLYFAYGSNLSSARLRQPDRAPSAASSAPPPSPATRSPGASAAPTARASARSRPPATEATASGVCCGRSTKPTSLDSIWWKGRATSASR